MSRTVFASKGERISPFRSGSRTTTYLAVMFQKATASFNAWAGVFLITLGVLTLNILARVLFRNKN